jgi:hypothetical protein
LDCERSKGRRWRWWSDDGLSILAVMVMVMNLTSSSETLLLFKDEFTQAFSTFPVTGLDLEVEETWKD